MANLQTERQRRLLERHHVTLLIGCEVARRGRDDLDIEVTAEPGCTWTASSGVTWVTVAEGATGTGKGKVRLLVQANDGPPRQAVLTIAGQPFEIRQDGR